MRTALRSGLLLASVAGCAANSAPLTASPTASPSSQSRGDHAPTGEASEVKGARGDLEAATSAIEAGQFAVAKIHLERVLRTTPTDATAPYYLGVVLEHLGDKVGAEQRYRQALKVSPGMAEPAINLAAMLLDATRFVDAEGILRTAIARRPDDPELHANLALALVGTRDVKGALLEYDKATRGGLAVHPGVHYGYGELLLSVGRKEDAVIQLRLALRSAGANRPLIASVARLLGGAGAFRDCVSALDRAIAAGDDPELRVRRGLCRHELADEAGAQGDFRAAAALQPTFAPAHYYLGESLLAAGRRAEGMGALALAFRSDPESIMGKKAKIALEAAKAKGK